MAEIIIREVSVIHPDYPQVYDLREEMLRKPLGLSLKDEDLSGDALDIILAAFDGDRVVGCVMLQPTSDRDTIKLRQMAVAEGWQGRGIGKKIVLASENMLRAGNVKKIILHARLVAEGFYMRLSYNKTGDTFTEVGIPHTKMEKVL